MPFIKVSGIKKQSELESLDKIKDIVNLKIGVPRERITVFYDPILEIENAKEVQDKKVIVDLTWMPRTQELCDLFAEEIKKLYNSMGYKNVIVMIKEITKDRLYSFKQ